MARLEATVDTALAVVQDRYGAPDVLSLQRVPKPSPGRGDVLVAVEAASVNARDRHIMRGEPRLARLMDTVTFGRRGPRVAIRGTDFAGVVEAVGAGVTRWRPGDAVLGEGIGTFAQHTVVPAGQIAAVPDGLPFDAAAALPLADTVIDYTTSDFTRDGQRYDVIIDLVGNRRLRGLHRVLRPGGAIVLSGGGVSGQGRIVGPLGLLVRAQLYRRATGLRILTPLAKPGPKVLDRLTDLSRTGQLTPIIDARYPLDAATDAIRHTWRPPTRRAIIIPVP